MNIQIKISKYPAEIEWNKLQQRPALDVTALFDTVRTVLDEVRMGGDAVIMRYGKKFDKAAITHLAVTDSEIEEAATRLPDNLKQAIRVAYNNIEAFHTSQRFVGAKVETMSGVTCWQKAVPIEKVGLYIPGGTAPLFSTVLMLAVPARIAGCREVVLCTPPGKQGEIHPAILFSAQLAGVSKIFKVGGIQAIAAMAYGSESIPAVYKIFGPGNQYVMAAKQIVGMKDVAVDMPAGPSEVAILADATADPAFIASDFLSQAEHGVDSQSILLTTSEQLANAVVNEIERQAEQLPRKSLICQSLTNSRIVILNDTDEMITFSNQYAPEHLIVQTSDTDYVKDRILNAGSVFLGAYTPESAGDYASGTNHTLPTNGYARAYSGVNLDSFIKKITFQEITFEGLKTLGTTIEAMAAGEQMDAHKNAVRFRIEKQ